MDKPSEHGVELAVAALEHAAYYLRAEPGLMAMLIVDAEGEQLMPLHAQGQQPPQRGAALVLGQDADGIRQLVMERRKDFDAYAIVFDAMIDQAAGSPQNAIVAEVGVRGETTAWTFVQPYKPKKFLRKFRLLGDAMLADRAENLL